MRLICNATDMLIYKVNEAANSASCNLAEILFAIQGKLSVSLAFKVNEQSGWFNQE